MSGYYFERRKHNNVTLYQDAHTPRLPIFDPSYKTTNCWKDIYEALLQAKKFIYITGWSVWTDVVLVRDEHEEKMNIGELLVKKSQDGVKVLGLVWDDPTSGHWFHTKGYAKTYDEETFAYFKKNGVLIERAARRPSTWHPFKRIGFTHHQKAIVCDADHPDDKSKRRLISFLGGLDLTKGRYDTPEHHLFPSLARVHANDVYQDCIKDNDVKEYGPREPWHDIHCKAEGRIALDVAINFAERWHKEVREELKEELINFDTNIFDINCYGICDTDKLWQCQLLRSITSSSAVFTKQLPMKRGDIENVETENSIHQAYVHHIREAKRFIYIENQYFISMKQENDKTDPVSTNNIIPMELSRRIVKAIEADQPFVVYIVIPLYPSGIPTKKDVQEMLHYQNETMKSMYAKIGKALAHKGSTKHPQDYLNFFCLGKREAAKVPDDLPAPPDDSLLCGYREKRRFMVYVHSKMMIVDDTHIIIGSANMNLRSMSGDRDTEIAMTAFQDNFSCMEKLPRGGVYEFRMALFAEHMNGVQKVFDDPSSVECVKTMKKISQENLVIYTAEETRNTNGHLLCYPIEISRDGEVTELEGFDVFPDTDAKVSGGLGWVPWPPWILNYGGPRAEAP